MKRRLALLVFAAMIAMAPAASAEAVPQRVDTDAAGTPDQTNQTTFQTISGDGRFAMVVVPTNSNLVPEAHRTAQDQGYFAVRKDLRTGATVLVSVTTLRKAQQVSWWSPVAMDVNGTAFAWVTPVNNEFVVYARDFRTERVRAIQTFTEGPQNLQVHGNWVSWTIGNGQHFLRHDLVTGRTFLVFSCQTAGCHVYNGPKISADGTKFLFHYRPGTNDPEQLMLLDVTTGQTRALATNEMVDGYALSGDGNWAFYSRRVESTYYLKKIGTAPGATPTILRTWENDETWVVHTTSASHDGRFVGYFRQTGDPAPWRGASPGHVFDQATGQDLRLPQAKSTSYLERPTISADGSTVVAREFCFWDVPCGQTGTYAVKVGAA